MILSQRCRRFRPWVAVRNGIAITVLAGMVSPLATLAQSSSTKVKPGGAEWSLPRTTWGTPDLQGTWDYRTATPLQRPEEFKGKDVVSAAEAASYEQRANAARDARQTVHAVWWLDYGNELTADRRTSLIIDPTDGRLPEMTDTAMARAAARREMRRQHGADSYENRGLTERCISFGFPRLPGPYNNNYLILQTPDHIVLFSEMIHNTRIVPLDGRDHLPNNLRLWSGNQRGYWEDDTLVVVTKNITPRAKYRGSTEHLQLVERFTRVGPNTLEYGATFTDPYTWTRPWTLAMPMTKTDEATFEYACHEGNYGLQNILHNARFEEDPDYADALSK